MISVQQKPMQSESTFNSDYAGRYATSEFEARGKYSLENDSENTNKIYDPFGVTFIQHPTTLKKLAVIQKPEIQNCNICYMDHKTINYHLEDNYCACYCENYKSGNWVFKKN